MATVDTYVVSSDDLINGVTLDDRINEGDYVLMYGKVKINTYRGIIDPTYSMANTVSDRQLIQELADTLYVQLYSNGFPFVYTMGSDPVSPYWVDDEGIWLLAQKRVNPLAIAGLVISAVILVGGAAIIIPIIIGSWALARIVIDAADSVATVVSGATDALRSIAGTAVGNVVGGFMGIALIIGVAFVGYKVLFAPRY